MATIQKPTDPELAPIVSSKAEEASPRIGRRQLLTRTMTFMGVLAVSDGRTQAMAPVVTQQKVPIAGLGERLRVVQLTDMHRSWCVSERYLRHVAEIASGLNADMILMTGDFVTHSSAYVHSCLRAFSVLKAPLGIYGILGNHDYWSDENTGAPAVQAAIETAGIRVLTNASVQLKSGLHLVGIDDCGAGRPDLDAAFRDVPPGSPTFAMTHNPLLYGMLQTYSCVAIAGHTHGGQIVLPGYTRQMFDPGWLKLSGWWTDAQNPGRMYVSRGLGVIGLPFRFRCSPEIAIFDLEPA
jgi:predicted MPP superfamily phosphohydrolase